MEKTTMTQENPGHNDRIDSLESDLKTLIKTVNSVVGAVDKTNLNVSHIEKNVGDISYKLNKITNKEFNWGNFLMAIGLLGAFWAAAIKPLEQNDHINAQDIKRLEDHKTEMLKTRFTNSDGDEIRKDIDNLKDDTSDEIKQIRIAFDRKIEEIRSIIISHQIDREVHK